MFLKSGFGLLSSQQSAALAKEKSLLGPPGRASLKHEFGKNLIETPNIPTLNI